MIFLILELNKRISVHSVLSVQERSSSGPDTMDWIEDTADWMEERVDVCQARVNIIS